jgi:hypothetical protein
VHEVHLLGHLLKAAEGLHVGPDGEENGLGLGESAERLALHTGAQPVACILGRDSLRLPLGIQADAGVDLLYILLHKGLKFCGVVANLRSHRLLSKPHYVCKVALSSE